MTQHADERLCAQPDNFQPPEGLVFKQDYSEDDEARGAFIRFLYTIHGLDLSPWQKAGFWNAAYRQLSLFDKDGEVVSSLSVYTLSMVIDGKRCRGAQFSGVGTLEARRRCGLNRWLTEKALTRLCIDCDLVFLFAATDALPFYNRCGFGEVFQHSPSVAVVPRPKASGVRLLDLRDAKDNKLTLALLSRRSPVSLVLDAHEPSLWMFHAMMSFPKGLTWIEELDVLVVTEQRGSECILHDVVGARIPRFQKLAPYLVDKETTVVRFGFVPDLLDVDNLTWAPFSEEHLCDRGDLPLRGRSFLFPTTSHA